MCESLKTDDEVFEIVNFLSAKQPNRFFEGGYHLQAKNTRGQKGEIPCLWVSNRGEESMKLFL